MKTYRLGSMLSSLVIILLLSQFPGQALAGTCRALLIGINDYVPVTNAVPSIESVGFQEAGRGTFSNLKGCVNDVEAMRQMLLARFQFAPADVHLLLNAQATRANILAGIQRELIDKAAPGDTCVFFYAGHGSQIRNLKSNKASGLDSTLVPADAWTGVMDVRDKELARLFNQALDKGVSLTALFDSCHSGSIARGLPGTMVNRVAPPDTRTVSDSPDAGKAPEERGALIISAAQDYQTAAEAEDDQSTPHGAFTVALLKALNSLPPDLSAEELFQSAQVILQAVQPGQNPVLAGTPERRQKPLFGIGKGDTSGHMIVAALGGDADTGLIALNGGQAMALAAGCELQSLPRSGPAGNPPIRLQITSVTDLAHSTARVLAGPFRAVQSGDLFEVTRWTYPAATSLRVWIPVANLSLADINKLTPELTALRQSSAIRWVADPTETTPTHVLSWKQSGWSLSGLGNVGKKFTAPAILKKLASFGPGKPALFVRLPIPAELAGGINIGEGTPNNSIQLAANEADGAYQLVGRWNDTRPEFAWIRPNASASDIQPSPLPVRTDWFTVDDTHDSLANTADQLVTKALAIGRLKSWLTLDAHGSTCYFPYHLALRNTTNGHVKLAGDTVYSGEPYGLVLQADPNAELGRVSKQWIYVVDISPWGKSQLLFPPAFQGNVGNRVPYDNTSGDPAIAPREIVLGNPSAPTLFHISKPFGMDTFLLLTSSEAIPQPTVFNSSGVRTRGENTDNPLQNLFQNMGALSRDVDAMVPTDWSIQKLPIKSEDR